MSHLGLVSSAVLSNLGIKTVCFDPNIDLINSLLKNETNIDEPGLIEILKSNTKLQIFTNDPKDLQNCDYIYVSQDVDTDPRNSLGLKQIEKLIFEVCEEISFDIPIVILSQSIPGFCEQISKTLRNPVYYQVETLVFGEAVERAKNPERIIIGKNTQNEKLPKCYARILELYRCPIIEMDFVSAELTKIAINVYLASDVTVTNSLAEVCKILGGEWSKIKEAIMLDKRIGKYRYLNPGLGLSGGNIERDLSAIVKLAVQNGSNKDSFKAILESSTYYKNWATQIIIEQRKKNIQINSFGFWGLSYKPFTNSIRNSPAILTIENLHQGARVFVHDPLVTNLQMEGVEILEVKDALQMLENIEVLLILCPWPIYRDLLNGENLKLLRNKIIIDPFLLISKDLCKELNIQHFTFYST